MSARRFSTAAASPEAVRSGSEPRRAPIVPAHLSVREPPRMFKRPIISPRCTHRQVFPQIAPHRLSSPRSRAPWSAAVCCDSSASRRKPLSRVQNTAPSFRPRAPRPHRRFLARVTGINPSARPLHRNALTGRPSCKTRAASPKAVAAHPNAAAISPALQRRTSPRVCFSLATPPRPRKSTRRPRGHTFPERNAFAPRPSAAFRERALAEKEF